MEIIDSTLFEVVLLMIIIMIDLIDVLINTQLYYIQKNNNKMYALLLRTFKNNDNQTEVNLYDSGLKG